MDETTRKLFNYSILLYDALALLREFNNNCIEFDITDEIDQIQNVLIEVEERLEKFKEEE